MIALTYHGVGDFRCESAPDPAIVEDGDAIVAVELAAICGSDLHVWRGRETGLDPGTVLGHEMTGRVVAIGRGVQQFAIGDSVMCPFSECSRSIPCPSASRSPRAWAPARSLMAELVPVARRHGAAIEALFTHRVSLDQGPTAYAMFDTHRDGCIKVALVPDCTRSIPS